MRRQYSALPFSYLFFMVALAATPAYASGCGMPWEVPLLAVADSITGPVAQGAAVVAVILRARPYLL